MRGPTRFEFLNEIRDLDPAGWDDPACPKLWRYNLHYFDDLNAESAASRTSWHEGLLRRWISENPPGRGSGWEPYPTSLRIVNWIKWALSGHELRPDALHSLAIQSRWLGRRLEWHLLGNHLLANAKALVFAGVFFAGREAERWLATGLALYQRELAEQILADGGHFERSPMYHAIILEDLLDLMNLDRAYARVIPRAMTDAWRASARKMRGWLLAMSHPDGEISFFNDAAIGIASSPAQIEAYALRLGLGPAPAPHASGGITALLPSGYLRLENATSVAILDVAPIGPDYLPGHAHADTLSFELSIRGRRVLVNSGTSVYAEGPERAYQRSTAAHNTLVVNEADSSEVWSAFRVARRAKPFGLAVSASGDESRVLCAHDGYRRFGVVHHRIWSLRPGSLTVEDRLEGSFRMAQANLHLHPAVRPADPGRLLCFALPDGGRMRCETGGFDAALARGFWHPEFGISVPNDKLTLRVRRSPCSITLRW